MTHLARLIIRLNVLTWSLLAVILLPWLWLVVPVAIIVRAKARRP